MRTPFVCVAFILSAVPLFAQELRLNELERKLREQRGQNAGRLRLLLEAAEACSYVRSDTTVMYAQEAIDLAKVLDDEKAGAVALAIRGRGEVCAGDLLHGRSDLQAALKIAERLDHLPGQLQAYMGLAVIADLEGWKKTAIEQVETAVNVAAHDAQTKAFLLAWEGYGLANIGLPERCMLMLDQAVAFASGPTNGRSSLAFAMGSRAFVHALLGASEKAQQDLDSALLLGHAQGDRSALTQTYMNLGTHHWINSDMPAALNAYLTALRWAERVNDLGKIAAISGNIGKVHAVMGEYATAMDHARRAADISRLHGFNAVLMNSLSDIGYDARGMGDQATCFAAYLELQQVSDSLESLLFAAEADISLAESYVAFGMPDRAVKHALRGQQEALRTDDPITQCRAYMALGNSLSAASDAALLQAGVDPGERAARAINAFEAGLADSVGSTNYTLAYEAYMGIGGVHERSGRTDEALRFHKLAAAARDSLLSEEKNRAVADLRIQYETQKKEQEIVLLGKDKEVQAKEIQKQKLMRNGFIGGFALVLVFAGVFLFQRNRIGKEKRRSEELLLNILPAEVAEELKAKGSAEAVHIDQVTVLFTDFKGFTAMSEVVTPQQLVRDLNECFSAFDHITSKYGIEKIKTIGDAYMAAGGLPTPNTTHATDVIRAALEMRDFIAEGKARKIAAGLPYFEIRIGIHTGPVVAGIVGVKKFQYDIWGDTVNTASRMESSGEVGEVNISEATYALVKLQSPASAGDVKKVNGEWSIANGGSTHSPTPIHHSPSPPQGTSHSPFANSHSPAFVFTPRGKVQAKGKGEMEMYFVQRNS
ncbi:MAG: adenylate/guanylate cyclase domain-containing protein [Flavobacteriales bacterium]